MATEQRANNNRVFIVAGVVLGIIAAALALAVTRNNTSNNDQAGNGTLTSVLVAKQNLDARTPLTRDLVTKQSVTSAPADALHEVSEVTGSQYLAIGIRQGTTITQSVLASSAAAVGVAPPPPPMTIAAGMVALSIPTTAATTATGAGAGDLASVGYYIHTGDHIDILIDPGNGNIRYGFQDVTVLQEGDYSATGAAAAAPGVFIIELPRAQAEEMTLLVSGTTPAKIVKYVLRPQAEYGKDPAKPNYQQPVAANATNNAPPHVSEPNGNQGATPQSLTTLFGP